MINAKDARGIKDGSAKGASSKDTMNKLLQYAEKLIREAAEEGEDEVWLYHKDAVNDLNINFPPEYKYKLATELEKNGFKVMIKANSSGLTNLRIVW